VPGPYTVKAEKVGYTGDSKSVTIVNADVVGQILTITAGQLASFEITVRSETLPDNVVYTSADRFGETVIVQRSSFAAYRNYVIINNKVKFLSGNAGFYIFLQHLQSFRR